MHVWIAGDVRLLFTFWISPPAFLSKPDRKPATNQPWRLTSTGSRSAINERLFCQDRPVWFTLGKNISRRLLWRVGFSGISEQPSRQPPRQRSTARNVKNMKGLLSKSRLDPLPLYVLRWRKLNNSKDNYEYYIQFLPVDPPISYKTDH